MTRFFHASWRNRFPYYNLLKKTRKGYSPWLLWLMFFEHKRPAAFWGLSLRCTQGPFCLHGAPSVGRSVRRSVRISQTKLSFQPLGLARQVLLLEFLWKKSPPKGMIFWKNHFHKEIPQWKFLFQQQQQHTPNKCNNINQSREPST